MTPAKQRAVPDKQTFLFGVLADRQWGNITNKNNATEIYYPVAYFTFAIALAVAGSEKMNLSNCSTTYGVTIPGEIGLTSFTPVVGNTEYEGGLPNEDDYIMGRWMSIGR